MPGGVEASPVPAGYPECSSTTTMVVGLVRCDEAFNSLIWLRFNAACVWRD